MKNQELLNKFNVEELEQRYETGRWISRVGVGYNDTKVDATVWFDV